jgi:PAS domain S-box-containing protein
MALATALNFVLLGTALLSLDARLRDRVRAAEMLSITAILLSLLAAAGQVLGVEPLDGVASSTHMAYHASLPFLVLGGGILAARPERGFVGFLSADTPGGFLARRLLVTIPGAVLLLNLLIRSAQQAGFFDKEFRFALATLTAMVVSTLLIGWTARALNRIDGSRRLADEALRQSREQLRLVADSAPVYLARCDRQSRYLFVNLAYAQRLGRQPREIVGKTIVEVLGSAAYESIQPYVAAALSGRRVDFELEIPYEQLGRRFMHCSYVPDVDGAGLVRGLVAIIVDVTERRQMEDALRDSEERFRMIADNIADLAWTADRLGWATWYNRRWYEYTGTTFEQMRDRGWESVHHPDHVERVRQKLERCLARGEPWEDTFPLRGKDGAYRWFLSRALPIRDDGGQVVRWFGTNTDVTERVLLEQSLKETDRRKDEFLAMLAHELRNPLAPIRNAAQILGMVGPPQAPVQQAREIIERQVAHLARLVDDLLDVSRITRGKINLEWAPVDLAQVVANAVEGSRPLIDARRHELHVSLPTEPVLVEGDSTRLTQVVLNLLNNSAKYTPEGGDIGLTLRREDGDAVISVRDNGVGIAPDLLPRVFDLFIQAERTLDRSQGGLGIGLTMVQRLIELHGGTVRAHSDGVGRGSEFVVRLAAMPCPLAGAGVVADGRAAGETSAHSRRRILVVDDNRDSAESLAVLLRLLGNDVRTALDTPVALTVAEDYQPHVVLLDIGLPGLDGHAAARRLRAIPALGATVLVALTGYGSPADRRRSEESGFYAHLVKPVAFAALRELLDALPTRTS